MTTTWDLNKRYFVERLIRENELGLVDKDIVEFLFYINNLKDFYTTSSCSGRIAIGTGKELDNKKEFKILKKWHNRISLEDLVNTLSSLHTKGNLWLLVRQPILHIACKNLDLACKVIEIAKGVGFESTNIMTKNHFRVVVEITSQERFDTPLVINGMLIYVEDELQEIVRIANEVLTTGKDKLKKFEEKFREQFRPETR